MNGSPLEPAKIRVVSVFDRFVVIDKPAGLLSVPGVGPENQDCAACQVCATFPHATGPLVCHRLDQATSGLMVFALDVEAQKLISLQFQRQGVEKCYEALLRGTPSRQEGCVELPLRADWPNRPRQMVDVVDGRPARTLWRAIESGVEGTTRVEFRPTTGKTHQLRLHAATPEAQGGIGCPIVGDELYDPQHPAPRLMLHATRLRLSDPDTLRRVEFVSVCPF
ncbi:MAG: RluA family pseudouridine synthase [Phycisphaeraceae bacterium]|nr:RluA family pseudouridine synthase [Phycisphaeraceae bacterium]MCW5763197.1 RluA family pseudouridine synthase [Phycisphaeraceae bacterium]